MVEIKKENAYLYHVKLNNPMYPLRISFTNIIGALKNIIVYENHFSLGLIFLNIEKY